MRKMIKHIIILILLLFIGCSSAPIITNDCTQLQNENNLLNDSLLTLNKMIKGFKPDTVFIFNPVDSIRWHDSTKWIIKDSIKWSVKDSLNVIDSVIYQFKDSIRFKDSINIIDKYNPINLDESSIDSLLSWGIVDTTELFWNVINYNGNEEIFNKHPNFTIPDSTIGFSFKWYYGKKTSNKIGIVNPTYIDHYSDTSTWQPFPEVMDNELNSFKVWDHGYFVCSLPADYFVDSIALYTDNIGQPVAYWLASSTENYGKDKDYHIITKSRDIYIPAHNPINYINSFNSDNFRGNLDH